jgi:hypothetical protein
MTNFYSSMQVFTKAVPGRAKCKEIGEPKNDHFASKDLRAKCAFEISRKYFVYAIILLDVLYSSRQRNYWLHKILADQSIFFVYKLEIFQFKRHYYEDCWS